MEETGSLFGRLVDAWPGYVGYAISFVTIGIMWANHHGIFQLIHRSGRRQRGATASSSPEPSSPPPR